MFKFTIDTDSIIKELEDFALELNADLEKGIEQLALLTEDHIRRNTSTSIKSESSRNIYLQNLKYAQEGDGVHVIFIEDEALWIEDGYKGGDMRDFLLKEGYETSANGYKYKTIPFSKNKKPTQMTTFEGMENQAIRSYMRKQKIPYGKLETDKSGKPIISDKPLHTFNLPSRSRGMGTTPTLSKVQVYQTMDKKTGNIRKDILTMRTISTNPATAHKWHREAAKGAKLLDEAYDWLQNEWENHLLPEILEKYK